MKKSELRQIIREEIQKLKESSTKKSTMESIKYNTDIRKINRDPIKRVTSKYFGTGSSLEDFKKLIYGIPNNIKTIKMPTELGDYNPKIKEFSSSKANEIMKIATAITKAAKEQGNPVIGYTLRSYFSTFDDEAPKTTEAYVQFTYKSSKAFFDMMSKDKFLD